MKESEDYNFQTCVKASLAEKIGCRPPWDLWSPASSPLCARVEDMARHEEYDWDLYNFEQKIVLNFTGCKVLTSYIYNLYLCIYARFPANTGSTSWWGNHRVDPLPSWACREGRDTVTGMDV